MVNVSYLMIRQKNVWITNDLFKGKESVFTKTLLFFEIKHKCNKLQLEKAHLTVNLTFQVKTFRHFLLLMCRKNPTSGGYAINLKRPV